MKYIYSCILFVFFSTQPVCDFAQDTLSFKTTSALLSGLNMDEQKIRMFVSAWDELKDREYDLKEFGLQETDQSRLFIKVFMAKIKFIKRHMQDEAFAQTLPVNSVTNKIDEIQLIQNTKVEVLNLLGFKESDVLPASSQKVSIFNPNK